MEWVAVVALVVSLGSLGWQVFTWRQRRKPAVLVLLRQDYNSGPVVDDYTGELIPGADPWHRFTIDVTAVNRGEVTFEVKNVWIADASLEPTVLAFYDDARPVGPGESLRESFDVAQIVTSRPDWFGPAIGVVELVAGETFTSGEPEALDAWSLARIRGSDGPEAPSDAT
jgi:hypothetical protein